jgi:hypothetical protein
MNPELFSARRHGGLLVIPAKLVLVKTGIANPKSKME